MNLAKKKKRKVLDLAINKLSMNHLETPPKGLHGKSKAFVTIRVYILQSKEKKRLIGIVYLTNGESPAET